MIFELLEYAGAAAGKATSFGYGPDNVFLEHLGVLGFVFKATDGVIVLGTHYNRFDLSVFVTTNLSIDLGHRILLPLTLKLAATVHVVGTFIEDLMDLLQSR